MQASGPSAAFDELYQNLARRLREGTCVVVLGPWAVMAEGPDGAYAPVSDLCARFLIDRYELKFDPGDPVDLAFVCTTLRARNLSTDIQLQEDVARFYRDIAQKGDLHPLLERLADLPFRIYINTCPDDFLTRSLKEITKSHFFNLYNYYKPGPGSNFTFDKDAGPLVYNILGHYSRPESLVLTGRQQTSYNNRIKAEQQNERIPDALRNAFKDFRHHIFLGCDFEDWVMRNLLDVLYNNVRDQIQPYAFLSRDQEPVESKTKLFFQSEFGMQFSEIDMETFVEHLSEAYHNLEDNPAENESRPMKAKALCLFNEEEDLEGFELLRAALELLPVECITLADAVGQGDVTAWLRKTMEDCQIILPLLSLNFYTSEQPYLPLLDEIVARNNPRKGSLVMPVVLKPVSISGPIAQLTTIRPMDRNAILGSGKEAQQFEEIADALGRYVENLGYSRPNESTEKPVAQMEEPPVQQQTETPQENVRQAAKEEPRNPDPPSLRRRYPGLQPFQPADRDVYFGRNKAIEELTNSITVYRSTVLSGAPGTGKTSLVQAGCIPVWEERYEVVTLRLQNEEDLALWPLDNAWGYGESGRNFGVPYLWAKLKRREWFIRNGMLNRKPNLVLVFDQFEEFLTLIPDSDKRLRFVLDLASVINGRIPDELLKELAAGEAEMRSQGVDMEWWMQAPEVRFLFVVRSQHLERMDQLKRFAPSIMEYRVELGNMAPSDARIALAGPARAQGAFVSPPFEIWERALTEIWAVLETQTTLRLAGLQLLGRYFEDLSIDDHLPADSRITPSAYGGVEGLKDLLDRLLTEAGLDPTKSTTPEPQDTPAKPPTRPVISIFAAEEDSQAQGELIKYLQPFLRSRGLTIWTTQNINPGKDWQAELEMQLQRSNIVVPLISVNYYNDNLLLPVLYGEDRSNGSQNLLYMLRKRLARAIPVLIQPVMWEGDPLLEITGEPVNLWQDKPAGYDMIMQRLESCFSENGEFITPQQQRVPLEDSANAPTQSSSETPKKITEFVALYAREDEPYFREFRIHIGPLSRANRVRLWSENDIIAGSDILEETRNHIQEADVILLFISADFYQDKKLQLSLMEVVAARHNQDQIPVVPILIRSCTWELDPFVHGLTFLNSNPKPVAESDDKDAVWVNVLHELLELPDKSIGKTTGELETLARRSGVYAERKAKKLFVFYAHEDERYFNELERQLVLLAWTGQINLIKTDRFVGLPPGEAISKCISEAEMILMLVSPDLLANDFYEFISQLYEFVAKADLVPVLIRECLWKDVPLIRERQIFPQQSPSISRLEYPEAAWTELVRQLAQIVQQPPRSPQPLPRLTTPGPKSVLVIESAGSHDLAQGMLLEALESRLAVLSGNPQYRLSDAFDLICGMGSGIPMALNLAKGFRVGELRNSARNRNVQSFVQSAISGRNLILSMNMSDSGNQPWETGWIYCHRDVNTGNMRFWSNHPQANQPLFAPVHELQSMEIDALGPDPDLRVPAGLNPSAGFFQNPELLLFHLLTHPDFPFQWPAGEENLRIVTVPAPHVLPADSKDSIVRTLARVQTEHKRIADWWFGPGTLPAGKPLVRRIVLAGMIITGGEMPGEETLKSMAEAVINKADLTAIQPPVTA